MHLRNSKPQNVCAVYGKGDIDFFLFLFLTIIPMIYISEERLTANPLLKPLAITTDRDCLSNPLRILLLNLMPEKAITEADIIRMLGGADEDIEVIFMKISGQKYKTTPQKYMESFYTDFEDLSEEEYDGMIVTGAPIEHLPFEEVRYWDKLTAIMDWAETHVRSSLYICWGAQAALYHHWSVQKYPLSKKMFGVFSYQKLTNNPLFLNINKEFPMPTSRHTEVSQSDILIYTGLSLLANSEEAGVGIVLSEKHRAIYITGHLEYALLRLQNEYQRDLSKGKSIEPPLHYYQQEQPYFSWKQTALTIYSNWIKQYVKK